ncbi:M3 family metallopeptidase [Flavimobilis sp. GY10621]|uniref:M3 family metallopeptidase n=1 Tax=Flavimobilis rhizosphaerae TaxID=2775421 RepID=A0ABR9DRT7_9MICO|nr:M3 family metallopeptidase [Flavimobilis rhizosphaerae]MBD9699831.1 M3 family metallopeptidase [Flavimobilis rhizosphaerae]
MTALPLDATNPLAQPSTLPYGLPDFARIRHEHLAPAIRAGMAEERAEVEAIVADPAAPDLVNTLEALERSGELLHRALVILDLLLGADSTEALEDLEAELTPELSAHHDAIAMHAGLQVRVAALDARIAAGEVEATDADRRAVETLLRDFRRAGVDLPDEKQETLRALNSRIAELEAAFGRVVLASGNEGAVLVTEVAELEGLAPDAVAAAEAAAREAGHESGWLLTLQLPTEQGVLASLKDRGLRARIHEASVTRGTHEGTDSRATLLELARLRAERAQLLGLRDHASYATEDATARTPEAVAEMLEPLVPRAVANARAEHADLAAALVADTGATDLAPSDRAFYAEHLRRERYALDDAALRPYLELDRVLNDGVFAAAHELFGITLVERTDLVGYHPEVRVWEVLDADGSGLGLFLGDFFTRPSKRGGAWMDNLVDQSHLLGQRPVVYNVLNVPRPAAGEPALLTWDEVITAFHEFGHALHGLLSNVRLPSQSGTSVPRDFVEFPSQVNEMWAWHPDLLARYARHHATGEPLPAELVATMIAARGEGEGFATTEYLGAALLDQAWHRLTPEEVPTSVDDVLGFEDRALRGLGLDPDLVPPRYRSTYFNHVFAGGYSAAYYGYIWSEVLDADTVTWFEENGGLTRANGERFRRELLALGDSTDPVGAFERLRGRPASTTPLLVRRGLADA